MSPALIMCIVIECYYFVHITSGGASRPKAAHHTAETVLKFGGRKKQKTEKKWKGEKKE